MKKTIEIEVAKLGKLTVEVEQTATHIFATIGDIDGNVNMNVVTDAIQAKLETQLPIHLKMGTINGNLTF